MKKIIYSICLIIFAVMMALCGVGASVPLFFSSADEVNSESSVIQVVNSYTNSKNKVEFTPLEKVNGEYTGKRVEGFSFKPTRDSANNNMVFQQTKVGNIFSGLNSLTESEVANQGVKIWMYFDSNINTAGSCYDLEVGFLNSENQSQKITFELSSNTVRQIVEDYDAIYSTVGSGANKNNYDTSFSNVPYGWVQVSLPFAEIESLESVKIEGEEKYNFSGLDSLYISQDTGTYSPSFVYFYSIELMSGYLQTSTIVAVDHQPYVFVMINSDNISALTKETLYIGERFNLPKVDEVFKSIWMGEKNLLLEEYATSDYFMISVRHAGETSTYFYGSDDDSLKYDRRSFKLTGGEYAINFCFGTNDGSYPAVVSVVKFTPEDYGTGVWFTENLVELKVGETTTLSYKIHKVFDAPGFRPIFKSTDETVFKIKDVDYTNRKVTIEAVSEGSANIEIIVFDDRINTYTDYENGITNTNLAVSVEKEKNSVDVVAILLYISAGMFVVYLGFMLYKVIKNRNNYDVR